MKFNELPLEMQTAILESDERRKVLMREYREAHKYCPKCGSVDHITTLAGVMYYPDDTCMDTNECTCYNCKDVHQAHDRISKEQWERNLTIH